MQHLVVVRPFGPWPVGEVVVEAAEVERILGSDQADNVVRIDPPEGN